MDQVARRRIAAARGPADARLVEDLLLLARADEHTGRHVEVDVDLDDIVLRRGRAGACDHRAEGDRRRSSPFGSCGDPRARCHASSATSSTMRSDTRDSGIRLECCAVADNRAQIVVADDGPGIPAADDDGYSTGSSGWIRHGSASPVARASACRSSPRSSEAHDGTVTVDESVERGSAFRRPSYR